MVAVPNYPPYVQNPHTPMHSFVPNPGSMQAPVVRAPAPVPQNKTAQMNVPITSSPFASRVPKNDDDITLKAGALPVQGKSTKAKKKAPQI